MRIRRATRRVRAVKLNSQVDRFMLNAWEPGEHLARKTANWMANKRDTFDAKYDGREEAGRATRVRDTLLSLIRMFSAALLAQELR